MLDPRETDIDGVSFKVEPLALKESRATFVRLVHMIGPAFAQMGKAVIGSKDVLDIDSEVALAAIGTLMTDMREEDLDHCCRVFGAKTKMRAENGTYVPLSDTIFAGRLTLMFKWLAFCIEVNYSDFLGVLKDMKARMSPVAKTPSVSASPAE